MDQWDKRTGPVYNKDADLSASTADFSGRLAVSSASRRRRLLHKKPDDIIDLHGLTRDEAWDALTVFFNDSKNNALEKILVIHGKGNHETQENGILKKMVRDFIERCPFAGESGYSNGSSGGTGSTWVFLKKSPPSVPGK
ncbi:MAG: Smr/MutS family protein [Treponema sp.]|nr:Smr/MutS family protein [Treponema sp.]